MPWTYRGPRGVLIHCTLNDGRTMDFSLVMASMLINRMNHEGRSALPDAAVVAPPSSGRTRRQLTYLQGWLASVCTRPHGQLSPSRRLQLNLNSEVDADNALDESSVSEASSTPGVLAHVDQVALVKGNRVDRRVPLWFSSNGCGGFRGSSSCRFRQHNAGCAGA